MIDETIEEIREMQTHSSSVVAIKAARALTELADRDYATVEEFERALEHNAGALRRANPSHASLHNAMHGVTRNVLGHARTVDEAQQLTVEMVDRIVEDVEQGKRRAAENAADTFEDGETLLIHDYSSTALEAIENALRDGVELTAYVTEARPRYLGRKMARTLASYAGVEPHLIVDSAAGHFLPECDRVFIGMDCIVEDTLYNRIGTYPIATVADREGVPVHVVGSGAKIISDDFVFENEIRSGAEVLLEPTEGVTVHNPAYDATPVELVDAVITDGGVKEY